MVKYFDYKRASHVADYATANADKFLRALNAQIDYIGKLRDATRQLRTRFDSLIRRMPTHSNCHIQARNHSVKAFNATSKLPNKITNYRNDIIKLYNFFTKLKQSRIDKPITSSIIAIGLKAIDGNTPSAIDLKHFSSAVANHVGTVSSAEEAVRELQFTAARTRGFVDELNQTNKIAAAAYNKSQDMVSNCN